jgi:hydrogenase maturation protease
MRPFAPRTDRFTLTICLAVRVVRTEPEGDQLARVLIIGYGSPLRGDDNIGCYVAHMLEQYYCEDQLVRVLGSHQLTPEMAQDVAASEFVLFLDAAAGSEPGEIMQIAVEPQPGPLTFAHYLQPDLLLAATMELYGSAPRAELLTIVGAAFELGDRLSPEVMRRVPEFFERAQAVVEAHRCQLVGERLS